MKYQAPLIGFAFLITLLVLVSQVYHETPVSAEQDSFSSFQQEPSPAKPASTPIRSAERFTASTWAGFDSLFVTPPYSLSTLWPAVESTDAFSPSYYADPVTDGLVPLMMVRGLEDEFISRHFRISDLVTRDGAPYARISTELILMLENIRGLAQAPIHITSGYRHPAYNADFTVGGAPQSYHMAGLAADISSPDLTPGELAELALAITECHMGIGLGENFIHIDLRDDLTSWTRGETRMDEAAFDDWVQRYCEALKTGGDLIGFEETLQALSDIAHAPEESVPNAVQLQHYYTVMTAYAATQVPQHGAGAVLLDLRVDSMMQAAGLTYRLAYVGADSEEAHQWNVSDLIRSLRPEMYFAFAIIAPDGTASVGAMRYDGE